jgi:hypothetical protein
MKVLFLSVLSLSALIAFPGYAAVSPLPSRVEAETFDKDHAVKARIVSDSRASKGAAVVLEASPNNEEWIKYEVLATQEGVYNLEFGLASGLADRSFRLEIDDTNVTGDVIVPNTGSLHQFNRVSAQGILLKKGNHSMKIVFTNGGFAVDYIQFNFIRAQKAGPERENAEVLETSYGGDSSSSSRPTQAGEAN